jgi:hypothetical protein
MDKLKKTNTKARWKEANAFPTGSPLPSAFIPTTVCENLTLTPKINDEMKKSLQSYKI